MKLVVHLEKDSLNTLDELIEVFDDWHPQLRASNFENFFDALDEDTSDYPSPHQDIEPRGMS